MKKYIIPGLLAPLVIAVTVEGVLIAISFDKIHKLNSEPNNLAAISIAGLNAASLNQPAVSVSEGRVYFPDLKIFVPLNNDSSSLLYSNRDPEITADSSFDITTRRLASLSPVGFQWQKACYPVRLKFEDKPSAYSPHEQNSSSIKLEDGRTLQIYPNEDPACKPQYSAVGTSAAEVKKAFEGAKSYE